VVEAIKQVSVVVVVAVCERKVTDTDRNIVQSGCCFLYTNGKCVDKKTFSKLQLLLIG